MPGLSSSTDAVPAGHVLVGTVGKAHGLSGHVFVMSETDNPERFGVGASVFLGGRPIAISSSRVADGRLIVGFVGVNSREEADTLRGMVVTVSEADRRQLQSDEWWPEDLVGLRVLDHTGVSRGVIEAVVEGVGQDRLVVSTKKGTIEIPFVSAVVPLVDVAGGIVQVGDLDGLFDGAGD